MVSFEKFSTGFVLASREPLSALTRPLGFVLLACVLLYHCLKCFRRYGRAAAMGFLLACCGCDHVPQRATALASPVGVQVDTPLAFSASKHDLGTVRMGDSARAVFTLCNISNRALDLSVGQPSCGCLGSSLSRNHLEPGEHAEFTLLLSNGVRSAPGNVGATNTLGIKGWDKQSFTFEAEAVLEGLRIDPYSLRLPADRVGFSPEPIRAEIILGPKRREAQIEILDVRLKVDAAALITLGPPALHGIESLGNHLRRRFQIPVALSAASDLESRDECYVQVTYRIDDRTADAYGRVLIFPEAVVPQRSADGGRP